MRILALCMLLFILTDTSGQVYGSQSMMETKILDYRGIQFLVKADIEIEATNEGGLGDRFHKVKLTSLSASIHQKVQVEYRGKTYYEYSFNNALSQQFSYIKINTAEITVDLTASTNCKSTSFSAAKQGNSNTISCSVEKGKSLRIAKININGANFTGFNELFALIDKLENQAAIQVANQNSTKNQSDPWGTNEQKSVNSKSVESNYRPSTLTTTNNSSVGSNYSTQSAINSQGYDKSGNYIGQGTYNKTGSGTFIPAGPGKLRADGNYDVIDKNTGRVEIISQSENQKILLKQQQTASNIASQQQKLQDMYKQQEQIRINQQKASLLYDQQVKQAADKLTQSVGAMASAIGSMIADAKAKKERERQRELMLAERRRAEEERIAMEKKFRKESRESVFINFKESAIPLSTSKVNSEKLYYFVYSYDQSKIEESGMQYYLSNVIEIKKSGDGTWPYKRNIEEAIQPLTPFKEIFHGYYTTKADAELAKKGFENMLNNTTAYFQPISFMEQKSSQTEKESSLKKSLWEDNTKLEKKNGLSSVKKDPFWDLDSSDNIQKNSPTNKKTNNIDFWSIDEPIKKQEPILKDSLSIQLENAIYNNKTTIINELLSKLPEESSDLNIEALKAHGYFLTNQTDKALALYKKYRGQKLNGTGLKWEDKITADITQLKKILNIDFTLIQEIML
ncbi:MAG: hypothetical protein B7X68_08590 [Sphingobacteriia bacterium 39-36-14]|nr:MAG: hypothetical protein B7X68_08590 [Sphingobacteriia bacterium 39-36-14]